MSDEQMFAAIPTVYKGVQFRSLLEARWAAMFDCVGIVSAWWVDAGNDTQYKSPRRR